MSVSAGSRPCREPCAVPSEAATGRALCVTFLRVSLTRTVCRALPRDVCGRRRRAAPSSLGLSGGDSPGLQRQTTVPVTSGDGALRRRLRGAQFCFVSPVAADARRSPSSAVGRGLRVTPSLARTPHPTGAPGRTSPSFAFSRAAAARQPAACSLHESLSCLFSHVGSLPGLSECEKSYIV